MNFPCSVPECRERLSRDDWTALSATCLRGPSGHSSMLWSRLCSEANHPVLNSRIRGVTIMHLESQNLNTRRISTMAGGDQSLATIPSDKVQVFCMLGQRNVKETRYHPYPRRTLSATIQQHSSFVLLAKRSSRIFPNCGITS
jgi:hypothetical protein